MKFLPSCQAARLVQPWHPAALKSGRFQGLAGTAHCVMGYYPQQQELQAKSSSASKQLDAEILSLTRVKLECVHCAATWELYFCQNSDSQAEWNHVSPPKLSSEGCSAEVLLCKTYCRALSIGVILVSIKM